MAQSRYATAIGSAGRYRGGANDMAILRAIAASICFLIVAPCFDLAMAQRPQSEPLEWLTEHQGALRRSLIVDARADVAKSAPVWIVLQGRGLPDAKVRVLPNVEAIARRERIVLVAPEPIAGKWNYPGESVGQSKIGASPADDAGFIAKLIEDLIGKGFADPARIYVSGSSQGGIMTWSLACLSSGRIAAAAPLNAAMSMPQMMDCKPQRVMPIMVIAGTHDWVVPYDGWLDAGDPDRLTSIPETMEFWRRMHDCTAQKRRVLAHRETADPTRTMLVEWTGCRGGDRLKLYRIQGGGHTLPALEPQSQDERQRTGARGQDFETAEEVWKFLARWTH